MLTNLFTLLTALGTSAGPVIKALLVLARDPVIAKDVADLLSRKITDPQSMTDIEAIVAAAVADLTPAPAATK